MKSAFRRIFVVLGLTFIVVGVYRAVRHDQVVFPALPTVILVLLLAGVSVLGAAASWSALFPDHTVKRRLRLAFITSQVGKHLPLGGAAQAFGQAFFSIDDLVTRSRASAALVTHVLVQIACASVLASLIVFLPEVPLTIRVICGALVLVLFIVHRGGLEAVVKHLGPRVGFRRTNLAELIPAQSAILTSVALCLIPIAATSIAFGLILGDLLPDAETIRAIPAFALAWLVGYLAIPVPAGLGVREAVLVTILGYPMGVVIAASVAHRIAAMTVEGVAAALAWRHLRRLEKVST